MKACFFLINIYNGLQYVPGTTRSASNALPYLILTHLHEVDAVALPMSQMIKQRLKKIGKYQAQGPGP